MGKRLHSAHLKGLLSLRLDLLARLLGALGQVGRKRGEARADGVQQPRKEQQVRLDVRRHPVQRHRPPQCARQPVRERGALWCNAACKPSAYIFWGTAPFSIQSPTLTNQYSAPSTSYGCRGFGTGKLQPLLVCAGDLERPASAPSEDGLSAY